MKNRCRCLDLEGFLESPELAGHISENISFTVPGFGCDYHLCSFECGLEFGLCVKSADNALVPVGVHLHFCGNAIWTTICESVLDDRSASLACTVHPENDAGRCFPIRVVCPDVIDVIRPGGEIYGQAAAFASYGEILENADLPDSLTPADEHAVMLTGRITGVQEQTFAFAEIVRDFYELEVSTDLGSLTVVILKKNLAGTPKEGSVLSARVYISLDTAAPPKNSGERMFCKAKNCPPLPGDTEKRRYDFGCIRSHSHAFAVLADAAERRDASRFGRCCAEKVLFAGAPGVEAAVDRWTLVRRLNGILSAVGRTETVLTVSTGLHPRPLFGGVLLDGETCLVFDTDEDGLVDFAALLPAAQCKADSDIERCLLGILAEAFCSGKISRLQSVMSENCIYRSAYSGKYRYGVRNIMESIREVDSNLDETNQYRYELIPASGEIRDEARDDLPGVMGGRWCFRLWQANEGDTPVAVVFLRCSESGRITNILLARNGSYLRTFAAGSSSGGGPEEAPAAVDSLLRQTFGAENTLSAMREADISAADEEGAYVWQKSDQFIRGWLSDNAYRVKSSELFDDCIGYACVRRGVEYAVYMYAYGERKTAPLDGACCAALRGRGLSRGRTVLVVYLHVTAEKKEDGGTAFSVGACDSKEEPPILWELGWIGNQSALLYYPRKEVLDLVRRFTAAYNSQRLDILKAILADNAAFELLNGGMMMNGAVYSCLAVQFKKYGVMKTAFVRFNDVVYCEVPYIDGLCYVDLRVNREDRIELIAFHPLDENYRELIVTDEVLMRHPADEIPLLENVTFLPASERSRFSMLLTFADGETRRWDAPGEFDNDAVTTWKKTTFTDRIFQNGRIACPVCRDESMYFRNYPQHHQGVEFLNGVSISAAELYHGSYPVGRFRYREGTEVFEYDSDGDFTLGRIHNLDPANPLYLLDTANKIAAALPEEYQQTPVSFWPPCGGYSEGLIMVSTMGKVKLQYHHNRHSCAGMWGWLDTELNTVIAPQYVFALNFHAGRAIVCKGEWSVREADGQPEYWCENEQWGVIDRTGGEIVPCRFDELYEIDRSDHLWFVHEGGWDNGRSAVFDAQEQRIILELDFDFDMGYMFNECFVDDNDLLVFVNHLPGKGKDLLYAYDLHGKKFAAYAAVYTKRTLHGQSRIVVRRDGQDIIVF